MDETNGIQVTCTCGRFESHSILKAINPHDCCSPKHVGDICKHFFHYVYTSRTRESNTQTLDLIFKSRYVCMIPTYPTKKQAVLKTLHITSFKGLVNRSRPPTDPANPKHRQRSDCQLGGLIARRSCEWLTTNRRPAQLTCWPRGAEWQKFGILYIIRLCKRVQAAPFFGRCLGMGCAEI